MSGVRRNTQNTSVAINVIHTKSCANTRPHSCGGPSVANIHAISNRKTPPRTSTFVSIRTNKSNCQKTVHRTSAAKIKYSQITCKVRIENHLGGHCVFHSAPVYAQLDALRAICSRNSTGKYTTSRGRCWVTYELAPLNAPIIAASRLSRCTRRTDPGLGGLVRGIHLVRNEKKKKFFFSSAGYFVYLVDGTLRNG